MFKIKRGIQLYPNDGIDIQKNPPTYLMQVWYEEIYCLRV